MIAPLDLEVARRLFVLADEDVIPDDAFTTVSASDGPITVIDPVEVAHDLGPDGAIAAHLGAYEDRASQRDLAATIADLYNANGIGLLEAGTGVGKSLGYLIPALR